MKRKCLDSALNGLNLCSFFCQMVKVMIQMCGLCWLTRHNEQVSVVVLPQRLHHPRSWCQTQWCPLCWWQPGHFWRAAWSLSSYNPLWWWRSSSPRWEQHDAICAARREKWFETPARRFKFQVCQVSLVMVLSGYLATCAKELVCCHCLSGLRKIKIKPDGCIMSSGNSPAVVESSISPNTSFDQMSKCTWSFCQNLRYCCCLHSWYTSTVIICSSFSA